MPSHLDDDEDADDLIRIELRMDGSAPAGRVTTSTGSPRMFSGWISLISVVDELARCEPRTPRPDARDDDDER